MEGTTTEAPQTTSDGTQITALGRLAGHCYDRRRRVLVLWILAIVGITVIAQVVGTHFQNKFTAGNTESQQAANLLSAKFPAQAGDNADVVFHTRTPIADNKAAIDAVVSSLQPLAHVSSVVGPFSPAGAHQISPNANIAYAVVQFDEQTSNLPPGAINAVIDKGQSAARPGSRSPSGAGRSPPCRRSRPGRARASASLRP